MSHGGHHHFHGRQTNGFNPGQGPSKHHYFLGALLGLYVVWFIRDFLYRPFIGHPITAGAVVWGITLVIITIVGTIWYRRTR